MLSFLHLHPIGQHTTQHRDVNAYQSVRCWAVANPLETLPQLPTHMVLHGLQDTTDNSRHLPEPRLSVAVGQQGSTRRFTSKDSPIQIPEAKELFRLGIPPAVTSQAPSTHLPSLLPLLRPSAYLQPSLVSCPHSCPHGFFPVFQDLAHMLNSKISNSHLLLQRFH